LKDAAGLEVGKLPDAFPEKMLALWHARSSTSFADLAVSVGTLVILVGFPRLTRKIPAPLVAIVLAALGVAAIH